MGAELRTEDENIRTCYAFHSTTHFSIVESNLILPSSRFPRLFQLMPLPQSLLLPPSFFSSLSFCLYLRFFHLDSRSRVYICSLHVQTYHGVAFLSILIRERSCPRRATSLAILTAERTAREYISSVVFFPPRDSFPTPDKSSKSSLQFVAPPKYTIR